LAEALRDICLGAESPQVTTGMRSRDEQPAGVPTLTGQAAASAPDARSGTQLLDTGPRPLDPVATQPSAVPQKQASVALFVIGSLLLLGGLGAIAFVSWPRSEPPAAAASDPSAVIAAVAELTSAAVPEPTPASAEAPPVPATAITTEPKVDVVPVVTSEPEPPRQVAQRPAARRPTPPPPSPAPETPRPPTKKKGSLDGILDTRK
jgi:hypothetical protein